MRERAESGVSPPPCVVVVVLSFDWTKRRLLVQHNFLERPLFRSNDEEKDPLYLFLSIYSSVLVQRLHLFHLLDSTLLDRLETEDKDLPANARSVNGIPLSGSLGDLYLNEIHPSSTYTMRSEMFMEITYYQHSGPKAHRMSFDPKQDTAQSAVSTAKKQQCRFDCSVPTAGRESTRSRTQNYRCKFICLVAKG